MYLRLIFILLMCGIVIGSKNIVLIVVDDLDSVLDGMTPLKWTSQYIMGKGAEYRNCFTASPICCPNRASILTGRYQHNHEVFNNSLSGGCYSAQWQSTWEKQTFAAHLKSSMMYKTFYAGKYLNEYGKSTAGGTRRVPVGWDWWAGLVGNSKYYSYSLSLNGTERKYGNKPQDYLTDVIKDLAVKFIKIQVKDQPFLMVLAPPAPHDPFTPASRHTDKYKGKTAKRTPNFNIRAGDKHWLVRMGPAPLPSSVIQKLDDLYRHRWETLLAVDELVQSVYNALQSKSLLDDTYIIFTSDNGYHIGQFSMPQDKRQPYETDIKVPLLIQGPGIVPSKINAAVSSVDLYATILDIAGIEKPSDGISLLKPLPNDRNVLIEYRGEKSEKAPSSGCPTDSDINLSHCSKAMACKCQDTTNNTYSCIRRISRDYNNIFCTFEDDQRYVESYDLNDDEYQLTNVGYKMKRGRRNKFRRRLKKMEACEDSDCVVTGPNV
ncbi:N-acetylglucosamine-6-sulfatase isoform X2 [Orussus abietinus]|nr:N-acetylglucosamine-6-sulfatase isoform X2 [Orussus abietinus]